MKKRNGRRMLKGLLLETKGASTLHPRPTSFKSNTICVCVALLRTPITCLTIFSWLWDTATVDKTTLASLIRFAASPSAASFTSKGLRVHTSPPPHQTTHRSTPSMQTRDWSIHKVLEGTTDSGALTAFSSSMYHSNSESHSVSRFFCFTAMLSTSVRCSKLEKK